MTAKTQPLSFAYKRWKFNVHSLSDDKIKYDTLVSACNYQSFMN